MAALSEIRAAVKAALFTVAPDVQCTGYVLADPSPPFFDVELGQPAVEYDQAMVRGHDLWRLLIRCCVAHASDIGAQKRLDDLVASAGSGSVKQALEADQTLGGIAQTVYVTELSGYRLMAVRSNSANARMLLGAEWTVEIRAAG